MSATIGPLINAAQLLEIEEPCVVVDCRFSLADPDAGEATYRSGHIPGAVYAHLERDLSAPVAEHGGRHPLPLAQEFAEWLATNGIGLDTPVVAYDDSRFAFASRFWWMLRALGYRRVQVLDGGLAAWVAAGGELLEQSAAPEPVAIPRVDDYVGLVDINSLREAMESGATLIDSREDKRYRGIEEPIDPVAGHIPGAVNFPWQDVTDDNGMALPVEEQQARWQHIDKDSDRVLYCGSGVTACVNLLSLELAGQDDARLYGGSWSDWCSWMD